MQAHYSVWDLRNSETQKESLPKSMVNSSQHSRDYTMVVCFVLEWVFQSGPAPKTQELTPDEVLEELPHLQMGYSL